jgi:phage terminase large subunit GpA-like protein
MNWLLYRLYKYDYTVGLHAFPRQKQAERFSKQRLDAVIKDSERIRTWYSESGSDLTMRKFVKPIDAGSKLAPYNFYLFGATWESKKDTVGDAARGMSLDFIVYDERQDHPDDVETVLGEGASHSEYKQSLTLGTPKLPGTQFDNQWESSDRNEWMVTCRFCGKQQIVTSANIFELPEASQTYSDVFYYGCDRCHNP